MASLVIRPVEVLRLSIGAGANSASPGVRGGITCIPFGAGPSITLEAGHYLNGDANGVVRSFVGTTKFASSVNRLNYTFVNAHLGLDFGTRNFTFFVHGGLSFMRATLTDVSPVQTAASDSGGTATLSFLQDPIVRMWTPSAKIGLVVYLQ